MSNIFKIQSRERGFTLIELLTVIIIIGVLAAIAIPVFSAQRSRAQDSRTVSDVRNIVTAAETYLADRTKSAADITSKSVLEYASSPGVQWEIKGNSTTNGYCIVAFNSSGKDYNSSSKLLSYDSTAGGLKGSNGSCGPRTGNDMVAGTARTDANFTTVATPAASTFGSTSVGSSTATPTTPVSTVPVNFDAVNSGPTGFLQTFTVPVTGKYKIETYGARGGADTNSNSRGGYGAYATGTYTLNAGQTLTVLVGQVGADNGGYASGGGGGTFVTTGPTNASTPLVIAGGGGGGGYTAIGGAGSTSENGGNGYAAGIGGTNGNGGRSADTGSYAGGGGGFYGVGANSAAPGGGFFPGNGGDGSAGDGGYGGGGAGTGAANGPGGGGGYSGGGAGYNTTGGGGGGSYVLNSFNGVNVTGFETNNTTKANIGSGRVVITGIQ